MSRLGCDRKRAARSAGSQAKPRLQSLADAQKKSTNPCERRALHSERAWLTINSLTS